MIGTTHFCEIFWRKKSLRMLKFQTYFGSAVRSDVYPVLIAWDL